MYPRNASPPPRIAVGSVTSIADGTVQTSGCSVVVRPEGGAESAGSGTIDYSAASGVVYYTPTQAETNYTAFVVIAYKADCHPAAITIVTTASSEAGHAELNTATQTQIDAIELWSKRNAVILSGIVTGAGTATEVFTISALGVTATITADVSGNRSAVVWS